MSTSNLQVESESPGYLPVLTAVLQPGVTQEISETHAPSALQVGEPVRALWGNPPKGNWVALGLK